MAMHHNDLRRQDWVKINGRGDEERRPGVQCQMSDVRRMQENVNKALKHSSTPHTRENARNGEPDTTLFTDSQILFIHFD